MHLGAECRLGEGWSRDTPLGAGAIGPLTKVAGPAGDVRPEMIGVYLKPGAAQAVCDAPASELADTIVNLDHIWGSRALQLAADLAELDEESRIRLLETTLLGRLRAEATPNSNVDVVALARYAQRAPARVSVQRMADAAGVSRRHLTRVFTQVLGVSPKRYCRLARFQAGLAYAGTGTGVKWAQVAAELGYADQSHMIAEFRELSSLTPEALATGRWFHPFIMEAQSRRNARLAASR
jgi:AraC-like DNA-binding protein